MVRGAVAEDVREKCLERDAQDGEAGAEYGEVDLDAGPDGGVRGRP